MASSAPRERVITQLLCWYRANGRHDLPWRRDRDPYHILVSELMLQQTQVSRVIPKYEAFIGRFPNIQTLARGPRADVLRAWQGLGYNSRALRLHALARVIDADEGRFPRSKEALLALPGIGPYTADAIRVFAFDQPEAAADVNVRRVIARVAYARAQRPTQREVDALASRFIEESGTPYDWLSALMDLGSTICTARAPACGGCPLRTSCKSVGVRPNEARSAPKQSRFRGSNRWWRGNALRALLDGPTDAQCIARAALGRGPTEQELAMCACAVEGLVEEGIAVQRGGNVVLAQESVVVTHADR